MHGNGKCKSKTVAEFKTKRAGFDEKPTLRAYGFVPIDKPIVTALYEVAYLIAKRGKPHTIVYQIHISRCALFGTRYFLILILTGVR